MAKEKLKKVIKGLQKASKTHAKQAKTLQSLKMKKGGAAKSKGKICKKGIEWAKGLLMFILLPCKFSCFKNCKILITQRKIKKKES